MIAKLKLPTILLLSVTAFPTTSHPAQEITAKGTILRGRIVANELGGQPLSRVRVSATGANQTESNDGDGIFTLTFPAKKPGQKIQLVVNKPKYVVINEYDLRVTLPTDPDAELLVILMCTADEREELARRYYRLKSLDAIQQTYDRRLKELQDAQDSKAAQAKLREERDQAKSASENGISPASTRPSDSSEIYAEALSFFSNGNVTAALNVLDEDKLRHVAAEAKEQKNQADKATAEAKGRENQAERAVAQSAQNFLLRAQFLVTQFRFDEAQKSYEAAIEISPDNFDAHSAFGAFNFGLNRYWEARVEVSKALKLARADGNKGGEAFSMQNLGVIDHIEEYPEARPEFEAARKEFEELEQQNPGTYLAGIAGVLSNLGNLDNEKGAAKDAVQKYEEALRDLRQLRQKYPGAYSQDLASTLNNLGGLYLGFRKRDLARPYLEESLSLRRQIAHQNREAYSSDLAETLINMGILELMQNCLPEAREYLDQALKIFRYLAEESSEAYSPKLAKALDTIGTLEIDENELTPAREHYEEALKIRTVLWRKNERAFSPDLAKSLTNIGILDWKEGRKEEALQHLHQAETIYKTLAATSENPAKWVIELGMVEAKMMQILHEPDPPK